MPGRSLYVNAVGFGVTESGHPFKVYQYTPTPSVPASDWRTFRVQGGLINNIHPDNDDTQVTPLNIVVPESSTLYKVWLNAGLYTGAGTITGVTIATGATGWFGYPNQPSGTGAAAPASLYILLAEIDTSTNSGATYDVHQYITSSLWSDLVGYQVQCNDGVINLLSRMSVRGL